MPDRSSMPAGWVDHPHVPITRRAILVGIAIMVLAVIAAVGSVYARRTRLEKTTEFWGAEAIVALQSSPHVILRLEPEPTAWVDDRGSPVMPNEAAEESASTPVFATPPAADPRTIELTGTPGLGHLRHALLDERHYDWQSRSDSSVESLRTAQTQFATLTFTDPEDRFPTATIQLELNSGWVGPLDVADRVQLLPRVHPAVRHFLTLVSNAQQAHYDNRRRER
jgi:hypothetical protein